MSISGALCSGRHSARQPQTAQTAMPGRPRTPRLCRTASRRRSSNAGRGWLLKAHSVFFSTSSTADASHPRDASARALVDIAEHGVQRCQRCGGGAAPALDSFSSLRPRDALLGHLSFLSLRSRNDPAGRSGAGSCLASPSWLSSASSATSLPRRRRPRRTGFRPPCRRNTAWDFCRSSPRCGDSRGPRQPAHSAWQR